MAAFARAMMLFLAVFTSILPAQGFGLKTHLWIANRVADEVVRKCTVKVAGIDLRVRQDICDSIRSDRGAFLAGSLGPDAYPDLITGQVTTHPGVPQDWQTSDWLKHLHNGAGSGGELAFSSGYLVHAASDTWAHSYVNAYAGDIFLLAGERAVERRHFVLEKFIDYHLPAGAIDAQTMKVCALMSVVRRRFDEAQKRMLDFGVSISAC